MHRPYPLLVLAAGCASITSGQRAETLGKGRYELGVETSYQATLERDTVLGFPLMAVAGRVGVSERLDLGGRLSSAGAGVSAKLGLLRGDALSLSLAPSVDWVRARDQGIGFDTVESALPLLGSLRLRPGLELLAAPRLHSSYLRVSWNEPTTVHTLGVGASAGVALRVARLWIVPELGLLWPFLVTGHPADEMGGTTTRTGRVITQLSVAFLFGGMP